MLVKRSGYTVRTRSGELAELPLRGDVHDVAALAGVLADVRRAHPEEHRVVIAAEDHVAYRDLVEVMDLCLKGRFGDLQVDGVDGL